VSNKTRVLVVAILSTFACTGVLQPACGSDLFDSQSSKATLSLEQAVALAIDGTPQVEAQAAAVEAAQSQSVAAGRLPDPELVVGIDNLPVTGGDAWSVDRDFMTMRRLGVMQSFPNGRKRASQRQRAAAAVSVAQSQAHQTQVEIAGSTAAAWVAAYAAELAQSRLLVLKPEVELQAQAARSTLASGRSSTVDALAAESEVSDLNDRLLQAERDIRAARAELARWIGEDAQRTLTGGFQFSQLPAPRETLLASLHRHASLLTFDSQQALAQSEIDLARAEKRPDWSAELAYSKRGDAFSDMVSLEFRVGLPLFSSNRQDPLISAKRADLRRLEAEREAELRMHSSEVTSALAAWDTAQQRIRLYESERLPLARQRSEAALSGYRAGRTELSALMASHIAELEVQRSYVELVRELGQAWVFLRYLDLGRESS